MPNPLDEPQTRLDDYDVSGRDARIGIEVEYPLADAGSTTWTQHAMNSDSVVNEYRDRHGSSWEFGGRITRDPSVGAEIITRDGGAHFDEIAQWYRNTIDYIEGDMGYPHEPVGEMAPNNGSTAGLHIHLSPISTQEARTLYSMSQTDWLKAFVCSTLHENGDGGNHRVFRGGRYCNTSGFDTGRYDVVHSVSASSGHYEWRLPEPMTPDHFELVVEFLRRFLDDPDDAKRFARRHVESGDSTLTSVRRAEAIGIGESTDEELEDFTVRRSPHLESSEFFWDVYESPETPYIYQVRIRGEPYYAFQSPRELSGGEERTYEVRGIEYDTDTILDASNLDDIGDDEQLEDHIQYALDHPVPTSSANPQTSSTTDYLLEEVLA